MEVCKNKKITLWDLIGYIIFALSLPSLFQSRTPRIPSPTRCYCAHEPHRHQGINKLSRIFIYSLVATLFWCSYFSFMLMMKVCIKSKNPKTIFEQLVSTEPIPSNERCIRFLSWVVSPPPIRCLWRLDCTHLSGCMRSQCDSHLQELTTDNGMALNLLWCVESLAK